VGDIAHVYRSLHVASFASSIFLAAFLGLSLLLAGCQQNQSFSPSAIDITGAEYGKNFKLNDPDGKPVALSVFTARRSWYFLVSRNARMSVRPHCHVPPRYVKVLARTATACK